jgi:hypothetical protein
MGTGYRRRWMYKGRAELVDQEIIVSPGASMAVDMGGIIEGVGWGGWREGIRGVESRREFVVSIFVLGFWKRLWAPWVC